MSFIKGWNHFWSVAEEARFYLLFPLVMLLLFFAKIRYLRLIILLILIYYSYEYRNEHMIDMLDGRKVAFYFFMFLGGIFTYSLTTLPIVKKLSNRIAFKRILNLSSLIVFILIFISSIAIIDLLWRPIFLDLPKDFAINGWHKPGMWFFFFVVFFFSLILSNTGIVYKILAHYFFRHIGLLSYSIYLSHMFVLRYLSAHIPKGELLFLFTLLISYVIAILTYVFIEKPFLIIKKRITNRVYIHT